MSKRSTCRIFVKSGCVTAVEEAPGVDFTIVDFDCVDYLDVLEVSSAKADAMEEELVEAIEAEMCAYGVS